MINIKDKIILYFFLLYVFIVYIVIIYLVYNKINQVTHYIIFIICSVYFLLNINYY